MGKKPKSSPATRDLQTPSMVWVQYVRTHYQSGTVHPKLPGHTEEISADEARGLASYGIVNLLERAPDTPAPPIRQPSAVGSPSRHREQGPAEGRSGWRYNSGGLLILRDEPRLIRG